MSYKTLNRFRKTAFLEGVSTILLFLVAVPVKYGLDNPILVKIIGPIHGVLFLIYCVFLIQAAMEYDWPFRKSVVGFIASLYPFGTFLFDRKLAKELEEYTMAEQAP